MGNEKKVVSIRLTEELTKKLRSIASDQNRTMSNLIETILKDYVIEEEKSKK